MQFAAAKNKDKIKKLIMTDANGDAAKQNSLPIVDLAPSPDFEKVAESCGGYGERVEDPAKLIPAIERALKKVDDGQQVTLNVITGLRPYG